MLKIAFNSEKNRGEISFKGDHFNDFYHILKEKHFQYDPDSKTWSATPRKILSVLSDLNDYEDIIYFPINAKQILEQKRDSEVPETEFIRNIFDESLLRVPPYLGKSPNEQFQKDCIKKGIRQNRLAYFLGMGLGKTYITINVLNHLFAWKAIDHILIISPSEGIYNWKVELMKFNSWELKEEEIYIANAENRNPFDEQYKVVIMTYRTFLMLSDDAYTTSTGKKVKRTTIDKNGHRKKTQPYRHPTIYFDCWGSTEKRAIILDESHKIKEHKASQSYTIGLHKHFFKYRYILTGTPSPNVFTELYSQMKFLDDALVPSYSEFISEIANLGNRFSDYAINYIYPEKQEEYEKKWSPWVIRLQTEEAIDLPPLYVKKIYAELPCKQKDIYQQLIEYTLTVLKEEKGELRTYDVYQKFPYLSQALDNPCLLKDKIDPINSPELARLIDSFKFKEHGKLEICESMIEDYIDDENRKIILFDYHPKTIDQLAEHFKKYDPLVIHGQNTPAGMNQSEYRNDIINEFKTNRNKHLLIASEIVLSVAVNLQEATRAIYFSRNYSFTDWVQSQARLHRIGTKESVIINPLIFLDSLDMRLDRALDAKHDLDNSIFKTKKTLNINEWRDIFRGKM